MTLGNKIKWILGILMVFILIVTTNLIDKNNFSRIKDSVVTIYEDRLIANDLIYEISKLIQDKQLAIAYSDTLFFSKKSKLDFIKIESYLYKYENTKLTAEEEVKIVELKDNLKLLKQAEKNFIATKYANKELLHVHLSNIDEDLYSLSKIQLKEGQQEMSISKHVIDEVELFTQIEIYLLIFLGILIQIIIIYNPKSSNKDDED